MIIMWPAVAAVALALGLLATTMHAAEDRTELRAAD